MEQPNTLKSIIMIVDDESDHRRYLADILNPFGFELLMARSGSEALEMVTQTQPDIILLDVVMPDMDGFEVCRRLKQNEGTKKVPIILMSSLTESVDIVTGLELGAADYITKPFQKEEILNRIKTHFVMRQLQVQLDQTKKSLNETVSLKTRELTQTNEQLKKDLAEQKRMETILKQAQKMEAVSTLSIGIAHDFNNILSIITGYVEMARLEMESDPSIIGDCLEQINSAAFRAKELVQNLLTYCQQSEHEKNLIQVSSILKNVISFIKTNLPPHVEIQQQIHEETAMILADSGQLYQLFLNLVRNAGQAMTDTGGTLTIKTEALTLNKENISEFANLLPGPYTQIRIEDSGKGMDADTKERIFDPYFTTQEPGEGTGLGLSVAMGIAVAHNGTIHVESEPGEGSRFDVLLPVRRTETDLSAMETGTPLPSGQGRILYVDDEAALIDFSGTVLKRAGYSVEGHTSSIDALEAFSGAPDTYDLVITDHIMPKMQGMDLAKKMLEIRPDIPILLLTGTKSDPLIEQARRIGIAELLQKPLPMQALIHKINALINKD